MNYLEIREGIVHADGGTGDDHTLCGVTSERLLESIDDYADEADRETDTEPCMVATDRKINCPDCARIIRYCCRLGTKSIDGGGRKHVHG